MDCVLYQKSNNEPIADADFHEAMDKLINRAKRRHADT